MHFLRFAALSAAAALTLGPLSSAAPIQVAQTSGSDVAKNPATTLLRSNTNLVLVDVVVTEREKPVHGLNRQKFHVLEDGREQQIVSFDEHVSGAKPTAAVLPPMLQGALPPNTHTNISTYPDTGVVNVLLLDALNTPLANQADVRRQMLQYMGKIEPGTSLAIFTLSSRLRLVEGFTTDVATLTRALRSPSANPQSSALSDSQADQALDAAIGEMAGMRANQGNAQSNLADPIAAMQQFQADAAAFQTDQRVRMTIEAMQQLARYLSGIPGRKNLIWFSGSFPIAIDPDDALQDPFEANRNYSELIRETSELLSASRVAVYPVNARGLVTPSIYDASYSPSTNLVGATVNGGRGGARSHPQANKPNLAVDNANALRQSMQENAAFQQIAGETGGTAYMNTSSLKDAVADAIQNGSSFYTIGFTPDAKALDGQFHKLHIVIDNTAFKLAYRSGYFAEPPEKPYALNPGNSLILAASQHGAPPSTQILFQARVLDAADPQLQGTKLPEGPAGEMAASLQGPTHRVIVDVKADAQGIDLKQMPDGRRSGKVEFVLIAYDEYGKRINYLDKGFQLDLTADQYARTAMSGIPIRLALDLPQGNVFLRIAVHDLLAGRAGALEVPWK
jgi:VWFA-related protein